jgi:hypothetical protein
LHPQACKKQNQSLLLSYQVTRTRIKMLRYGYRPSNEMECGDLKTDPNSAKCVRLSNPVTNLRPVYVLVQHGRHALILQEIQTKHMSVNTCICNDWLVGQRVFFFIIIILPSWQYVSNFTVLIWLECIMDSVEYSLMVQRKTISFENQVKKK